MGQHTKLTTLIGLIFVIASLSQQITPTNGANILGIFTSHSPSHLIVHMSVMKVMAERGHNVTVVLTQKPKVTHKDINVIIIPPSAENEESLNREVSGMALKKNSFITTISNIFGSLGLLIDMQKDALQDPRFTALYDNPQYDLVVIGFFFNTFELGAAAKFKAPLAISWSGPSMAMTDALIGNPLEIAYVPNINMAVKAGEKMSLLQRIQNVFMNGFMDIVMSVLNIKMERFYSELFPNDGNFPTLKDMMKNVSLVLVNGHFSEGPIRPNVPALVEIGGIQVKDVPDPLPKDIADFLDGANEHGAILFSLGSNLKGSSIKPETATYIYNVLSKLKQKVIWKWEDLENTPGNSPNILYKKWMPQDDILAHRNMRLFITHAGKGGVVEAQYHGVPMLALPVFADQHGNAQKVVKAGYGRQLELLSLTEEALRENVLEVLNNPVYSKNVKEFSQLYRDRPLSARENAAFWLEYVIRHRGAAHMQSPLVHMNFIESNNLDVFAILLGVVYVLYRIFRLVFCLMLRKIFKKKSCNAAKDKTKKKRELIQQKLLARGIQISTIPVFFYNKFVG
ncbi:UDP-glucosyltransferase 2-like [Musca vetustissima]|uniref:UDP-glucosyltransferase 2-like n=1 Tax=Musca vetustissima TaxID=27455 RepID=UPI002AB7CDD8|nr:UDP-glucosyltransferase 2-like [Musca vetustissima]